jgi:hypothetical protein
VSAVRHFLSDFEKSLKDQLQLASLPSTSLKQNMNVANFWGIALRSPG